VGARHGTLAQEAWNMSALGIDLGAILDALVPAFVAAAGEHRRDEGARTVRDSVEAQKKHAGNS
jgi:hypothetical protein